jgi:oligopeptide/dipeptide ABC transporter ATP-binding protein
MSEERAIGGEPPSPSAIPSGCAFRTRCQFASDICAAEMPPRSEIAEDHSVSCHHWRELRDHVD